MSQDIQLYSTFLCDVGDLSRLQVTSVADCVGDSGVESNHTTFDHVILYEFAHRVCLDIYQLTSRDWS